MTQPDAKLLIVDDDKRFLASVERALRRDFAVLTASDPSAATKALNEEPEIILLDIRLDATNDQDKGGVQLLRQILDTYQDVPVVMTSAFGDVETAVECMRLGAADFVQKSAGISELRQRLKGALEHAQLSRKVAQLEEHIRQLEPTDLVGESPQIQRIKHLTQMVAQDGYITVLIRGETGTGKELVARSIHRLGWRAKEPFIPVAVASLNPNLVESELFGHEAGSFSGATKRHIGFIEKAKRGVLFLDEVGELPHDAQLKLLRFLEERKFSRVGSSEQIEIDVQVVAATNRTLEEAVERNQFRKDLYFRLQSVQLFLPALKERLDDIPLLVSHFLKGFRNQGRTRIMEISDEAMKALAQYEWPGNVRELKGLLERAIIYANYNKHQRFEKEDLMIDMLSASDLSVTRNRSKHIATEIDLNRELAILELSLIEEALQLTEERKTEAWKILGLNDRFALRRRVKKILKEYPSLISSYPTVHRLYK